jgi:hypothetical protein
MAGCSSVESRQGAKRGEFPSVGQISTTTKQLKILQMTTDAELKVQRAFTLPATRICKWPCSKTP